MATSNRVALFQKPWDQHTEQQVPIHEEERKTGWDGLSDERKKQIEVGPDVDTPRRSAHLPMTAFVLTTLFQIGGGLVAGLAALGACLLSCALIVPSIDQVWFVGPIAERTGDIGFELAFVSAGLFYVPLRYLELRFRPLV